MIWFLKPRLRSLCGRTIELRITTSDGMLTLQPGGEKHKQKRGREGKKGGVWEALPFPSEHTLSTQDGDRGREFSVPEEGLAVHLSVGVVGVRVARGSLHSGPLSDGAVPPHNAVQDAGVVLQKRP